MQTVLLHSCCAPCSAAILEWMIKHDYKPVVYYYNPNIFPRDEYEKRKEEINRHCARLGVEIIDGDWDHKNWLTSVRGLEHEPERGARCQVCFDVRLMQAARCAHERGIPLFTTTLASSRWKSLEQVSRAGKLAASQFDDVEYWDKNWRKDGLQDRRNALLKTYEFYNQTYCGCEFSLRDSKIRAKEAAARVAEQIKAGVVAARAAQPSAEGEVKKA